MELMTWDASLNNNNGGFKEGYYLAGDASDVVRWRTLETVSAAHYALLTVTVTVETKEVSNVTYQAEAILAALVANGNKFSVTVEAKDVDNSDAATEARFYTLTSAPTLNAPAAAGADELVLSGSGASWTAGTYTYTFYCGLYIDGANSTQGQNVNGNIKVTVAEIEPQQP